MAQLERERLLEDQHVDAMAELGAQERLGDRGRALRGGQSDHDERRLDADVAQHELGASPCPAAAATTASTSQLPT